MIDAGQLHGGARPLPWASLAIALLAPLGLLLICLPCALPGGGDAPPPDTTPPAAVEGLSARDAHDGKVDLAWTASEEADFAYYAVYYDRTSFLSIGNRTAYAKLQNITARNTTVSGLEDGTEYFFAVTAVDHGGNENRTVLSVSATPTALPVPDTTAPPAVTGIAAADARDGRVNLTWVPVNISDFDHYSIYLTVLPGMTAANLTPAIRMDDMAAGNATIAGLKDNTRYFFAVTAADRTGNENRTVPASASATPTPSPGDTTKGTGGARTNAQVAPYYCLAGPLVAVVVAVATFITLLVAHGGQDEDESAILAGEPEEEWSGQEDTSGEAEVEPDE